MVSDKPLVFKNRHEWRRWLEHNHDKEDEVWLVIYKKRARKLSIAYEDAVEESICFGWIDTKVKKIDEERFMQRYVPRKPNSVWSLHNKKRALKMLRQGRMTKAGLDRINDAKKIGMWDSAYTLKKVVNLPDDLKRALFKDKRAWINFCELADGYKNWYIFWINDAKQKETRERRIEKVVNRITKNMKPGMP